MPLHLNSFVEEKKDKKIFAEILDLCIKAQNPISSDGVHFHMDYSLVDEEKDLPLGLCDLVEDALEALLELTAELCPRDERAHIE